MLKKNHFLLLYFAIGLSIAMVSCAKKDTTFNAVELQVEQSKIALLPAKSINVKIENGNGEYRVSTSNENVARASVAGDVVTITATSLQDRSHAVIIVTDKAFKRTSIDVEVAKVFNLTLDQTQAALEVDVPGKSEVVISISTGNFGYKTELMENSAQFVSLDPAKLESYGQLGIKARAAGIAKVKLTDAQGKEALITVNVSAPTALTLSKTNIALDAIQASEEISISSGNGGYKATIANKYIAKASISGNTITITGKTKGNTTMTLQDKKGRTVTVNIAIDGPEYAMNLSDQYFGYANFSDIAIVDESIKRCKQTTFELTCRITGYRGLQTFMGLEGKLMIRGKNDDFRPTHPIQISGLGDKVVLESTKNFNLNEWMNIALVVDCERSTIGERYKLYINGVQDVLVVAKQDETHSTIDLTSSSDGNRFVVGRAAGQDFRAMKGSVSEARVWTVARTEQQIKDNMCGLKETSPAGLLARWNFNAGAETEYIQDSNGGKYETNLVIANAKTGGSYSPFAASKSAFVSKGCPN
ncbi:LamG-like jellyroll fold domain-containing protein [Pedobacter sp. GR22-6]|uniref:LamG-like jellyroll fold domain-containing protein n=1 Tax=Pedobacter sp. GR22-6 TaxID=3127957 RepID=UPI00307F29FB